MRKLAIVFNTEQRPKHIGSGRFKVLIEVTAAGQSSTLPVSLGTFFSSLLREKGRLYFL